MPWSGCSADAGLWWSSLSWLLRVSQRDCGEPDQELIEGPLLSAGVP